MTDEHWCKMAKKGHPSPGFEPAPLEGSKKVKKFEEEITKKKEKMLGFSFLQKIKTHYQIFAKN